MAKCTWKECQLEGTHEQTGKDGSVWAVLCNKHHGELEEQLRLLDAKKMLRAYILAQGGAQAAAERMMKPLKKP